MSSKLLDYIMIMITIIISIYVHVEGGWFRLSGGFQCVTHTAAADGFGEGEGEDKVVGCGSVELSLVWR